jgi:hypothetical protein
MMEEAAGGERTSSLAKVVVATEEDGVEEEVFQSRELMSIVVSLSDMSIVDLWRFALVCRFVFLRSSQPSHVLLLYFALTFFNYTIIVFILS